MTGQAHESNAAARPRPRSSRAGTLAERQHLRREAMLAAGLELFGTQGYTATRVDEVCRRASVSTRNFYEEFDNRFDLLVAVGDRIAATAFAAWTTATATAAPAAAATATTGSPRVRARVAALVHALVDDPCVARVAFVETLVLDPAGERSRRATVRIFPDWIVAYLHAEFDRRGLSPRERRALAVAAFGAADELIADWVLSPVDDRPPVDTLIDEVTAVSATILGLPGPGGAGPGGAGPGLGPGAPGSTPRRPGPARPG